jgi:hypothetical protein
MIGMLMMETWLTSSRGKCAISRCREVENHSNGSRLPENGLELMFYFQITNAHWQSLPETIN